MDAQPTFSPIPARTFQVASQIVSPEGSFRTMIAINSVCATYSVSAACPSLTVQEAIDLPTIEGQTARNAAQVDKPAPLVTKAKLAVHKFLFSGNHGVSANPATIKVTPMAPIPQLLNRFD